MANIKERIKKEIKIQKTIDKNCNDKLLLWFLNSIKYQSQWNAFVTCKFHKYGKFSYQAHRFYFPTQELLNIFNAIK